MRTQKEAAGDVYFREHLRVNQRERSFDLEFHCQQWTMAELRDALPAPAEQPQFLGVGIIGGISYVSTVDCKLKMPHTLILGLFCFCIFGATEDGAISTHWPFRTFVSKGFSLPQKGIISLVANHTVRSLMFFRTFLKRRLPGHQFPCHGAFLLRPQEFPGLPQHPSGCRGESQSGRIRSTSARERSPRSQATSLRCCSGPGPNWDVPVLVHCFEHRPPSLRGHPEVPGGAGRLPAAPSAPHRRLCGLPGSNTVTETPAPLG